MKLYLVTNRIPDYFSYDFYDSFVICCSNMDEAWQSHPTGRPLDELLFDDWPDDLGHVDVKYLGEADPDLPFGIVCSSFNSG